MMSFGGDFLRPLHPELLYFSAKEVHGQFPQSRAWAAAGRRRAVVLKQLIDSGNLGGHPELSG